MPLDAHHPRRARLRTGPVAVALVALAVLAVLAAALGPLAPARPAGAATAVLEGQVRTGDAPAAPATVTLWRAGGEGQAATALASAEAAPDGRFALAYDHPAGDGRVLYVLAEVGAGPGPRPAVLASVLGPAPVPAEVVVNERTTVASAYGLAQFSEGGHLAGLDPGITNAAGMVANLADATTGELGEVLASSPNGDETSTRDTFNSLANLVAGCVASAPACEALFDAATPPGQPRPADTFAALGAIARHPGHDVDALFALTEAGPSPYQPARTLPPPAWTLALRFDGDGRSVSGPGNFAIDHEGNLWVANNYEYDADPATPVCGSDVVLQFTPTGRYVPGSPFSGGGLSGAGFGVDIDPYGDVWVANYGFAAAAPGCPEDRQPPHDSVSLLRPDGTPVSPATGFTQGGVSWPQGMAADPGGDIWIANCGNDTVTVYPDGDPGRARSLGDLGLSQPFAIAHNGTGRTFVTGAASDNVAVLDADGTPVPGSPVSGGGIYHPMGIAADSTGHVWVANSGLLSLPCPERPTVNPQPGSMTLLAPDGQPLTETGFTGGGLTVPWGVAVDGDDNVWVVNFAGKRLSHLCGTKPATCPPGSATGDAISPDEGYAFDGLVRNTGVAVDPSGNVWVTNNWLEVPLQTNPGGHQIVAYVGLAAPVQPPAPIERPDPLAVVPRYTG